MALRRVLYIQYTNPAGYPPLEHSSQILADQGAEVLFLGTDARGTKEMEFPRHCRITVRRLGARPPGIKQKLHYGAFSLWCLSWGLRWRPQLIYASDPLSCPVALVLSYLPGLRVLYHEHDSPFSPCQRFGFHELIMRCRRQLARRAAFCIVPNQQRVVRFKESTGTRRPVLCIWNCPSRKEALTPPQRGERTVLHYHGNIGPELLPLSVVRALAFAPDIHLRAIGYTTLGQERYLETLHRTAREAGVSERVHIEGPVSREKLLAEARKATIGLALMPTQSRNPNFQGMVGASNKPFDYLACGLALLVSDLPEWQRMFVEPRYGLACDPNSPENLARALIWLAEHKQEARSMGERGRQRILRDWNYESQFENVGQKLWELEVASHPDLNVGVKS